MPPAHPCPSPRRAWLVAALAVVALLTSSCSLVTTEPDSRASVHTTAGSPTSATGPATPPLTPPPPPSAGHPSTPAPRPTPTKLLTAKDTDSETHGRVYTVWPDGSLRPKPEPHDDDLWALFREVIGSREADSRIASVEIFDDENNDSLASVIQSRQDPDVFHLTINSAYSTQRELVTTIVHEFAHAMSLSSDQVDPDERSCPRLELDEGCARTTSHLEGFYARFWAAYGDGAPSVNGATDDEVAEFYAQHRRDFVTEYAATNVTEDFAETFAEWVIAAGPARSPKVQQKYSYLESRPQLAALRDEIRANIARGDLLAD